MALLTSSLNLLETLSTSFLEHAVNKIRKDNLKEDITEESFKKYLYNDLPDVDLMIRTSGEVRLSNFLLWEVSYAEFIFTPVKFPDFSTDDFDNCIVEYTTNLGNKKNTDSKMTIKNTSLVRDWRF